MARLFADELRSSDVPPEALRAGARAHGPAAEALGWACTRAGWIWSSGSPGGSPSRRQRRRPGIPEPTARLLRQCLWLPRVARGEDCRLALRARPAFARRNARKNGEESMFITRNISLMVSALGLAVGCASASAGGGATGSPPVLGAPAEPGASAAAAAPAPAGPAGRHVQGPDGRGHHRVPAGQRPEGAAVPRPVQADPDREHHLLRGLAPRRLRRDRHGPPAGAHGVQGHRHATRTSGSCCRTGAPSSTAPPGTTAPTTTRSCRPRPRTWSSPSRWRPTGWSTAASPRRTWPRSSRWCATSSRWGRTTPPACWRRRCSPPPSSGTTTARPPSARAATSRRCRSRTCRSSTGSTTSRTTPC